MPPFTMSAPVVKAFCWLQLPCVGTPKRLSGVRFSCTTIMMCLNCPAKANEAASAITLSNRVENRAMVPPSCREARRRIRGGYSIASPEYIYIHIQRSHLPWRLRKSEAGHVNEGQVGVLSNRHL